MATGRPIFTSNPWKANCSIRYRIDGLLYEAAVPPAIRRYQAAIISRLKIMADMNIAERRLPQDGKIKIRKGDQDYDLRVSTIPDPLRRVGRSAHPVPR